jgi:hypothetical protein
VAAHVPSLAAAAFVSFLLRRLGFLGVFFLVPLGFAVLYANAGTALGAAAAVLVLEGVLAAAALAFGQGSAGELFSGAVYTALVMGSFIWIMSPGPVRVARRIAAASAAVTAFFLFIMFVLPGRGNDGFSVFFRSQAELLSSLYTGSAGGDAVRRSFLERYFTAERILDLLRLLVMRGGALASSMLLFFASRRLSFFVLRLIRRLPPSGRAPGAESLVNFHAPGEMIWVLSFSLLGAPLFRLLSFGPGEILAWNALTLSALVFLAQGCGILFWFLAGKVRSPFARILVNVALAAVILSPGINAFALALLALLGVAENWAPLRASGKSGSSPTPGM